MEKENRNVLGKVSGERQDSRERTDAAGSRRKNPLRIREGVGEAGLHESLSDAEGSRTGSRRTDRQMLPRRGFVKIDEERRNKKERNGIRTRKSFLFLCEKNGSETAYARRRFVHARKSTFAERKIRIFPYKTRPNRPQHLILLKTFRKRPETKQNTETLRKEST